MLYKFHLMIEASDANNEPFLKKVMRKEKDAFKVTVENLVDYDNVPKFKYLRKVKYEKTGFEFGCQCDNGCSKTSECCPKTMGNEFVYDIDGRICALSHQMIVECNAYCNCELSCPNRRKKTTASVCIFKTSDRGWALKTLESIPAGSFVIEYTGEVIDQAEALRRSTIYKQTENNYLFDLDYNEESEATYSIDATHQGNLSRFINHSCNANLQTWPVTSCNENPKMHRLYYFAMRNIRAGEELTVDYSGGILLNQPVPPPREDSLTCKCGAVNCKGYIF